MNAPASSAPATDSAASAATPAAARLRRPEVLAPAGDWDCVRAAVENGADAIYFGLDRFNARMRAHNFTTADLPALMEFLHRRGVRGYVTFNTLVFSNEIADATDYLKSLIAAGVDAAIVQDVGMCRLIRALSPDFPIHCSTQMTITSAAGVEFARELGAQLVVLARENSVAEIGKMQAALAEKSAAAGASLELPLEVFVHGALCVAYSGQCLTSESLGGRSANRGECAQACRMPYDLVADGRAVPLDGRRYLLSPQDLAGLDVLPDLVRLGITSLKIEGRLKSPEYVANVTRVYRQALDRALHELAPAQFPPTSFDRRGAQYDLEMGFSRGLYTGWFRGVNNQELAHARFGTKRGVFVGDVVRVERETVVVRLAAPLKPGDGIVFDAGTPEAGEQGGRVYAVQSRGTDEALLAFGHGDIDFRRVHAGDRVWKTNDPELDKRLRASFAGEAPRFARPVFAEVHGHAGAPLTFLLRDETGHSVRVDSAVPLAVAEKQPLTAEKLREQLGRLGGTPFRLERLESRVEGAVMLPVSELNRVRREAVAQLEALRAAPRRWTLDPDGARAAQPRRTSPEQRAVADAQPPELIAVIRHARQLDAAWSAGVRTVYCEFENPKHYRDAVVRFRELQRAEAEQARTTGSHPASAASIWVAAPRVFKPGEEWILKQVRSSDADGYLVRNHEHLQFFAGDRRRGDFSLNVANEWSADYYRRRYGLERVTASYDLNVAQLEALLAATDAAALDVTIHQHMPMFHMEHCVFCAFLSTGTDYRNCGRPCDRHDVRLRDRVGAEHPLKADAGCRNTVYNARAQTGAEFVGRMLELGVRHFRVEFLNEDDAEVAATLARYRQVLAGEISGADLWREFKLLNQLGVTRGQLDAAPRTLLPKGGAPGVRSADGANSVPHRG